MQEPSHGGDVYAAERRAGRPLVDFSANINPLGLPAGVEEVLSRCGDLVLRYPDPLCRELAAALARAEGVARGCILCGNGAADLIFRLVWALRPRRALVLAPTFAEYEQALRAADCAVCYHILHEQDGFCLTPAVLDDLTPDIDLLFLCNPNNPTGQPVPPALLRRILARCGECGIRPVVDECFIGFLDEPGTYTVMPLLGEYPSLCLLKAFTKLYAMPGLRLGYAVSADGGLLEKMARCAQPWSVSGPAQAAGIRALAEEGYPARTRIYIAGERAYLKAGLAGLGMQIYGSMANFIFFRAPPPGEKGLRRALERQGVLIRSCQNFKGLDASFYRVAVRTREENALLLRALAAVRQNRAGEGGNG